MRKIVLTVLMTITLSAENDIVYKGYGDITIVQNGKELESDGIVKNHSKVILNGKGKVVFIFPCGAPYVVKVKQTRKVDIAHECKENSILKKLVRNFVDNWFKEDEKIVISASSRSVNNIERGVDYFIVDKQTTQNVYLPIYDEEAEYKVFVNKKQLLQNIKTDNEELTISTLALAIAEPNRVEIYEDGVKIYDFMLDIISKDSLDKKFPDSQLSYLEKALLYGQASHKQLYINNLNSLLKGK